MESTASSPHAGAAPASAPMSGALVALFSLCAGVLVVNLYYAQPIIEMIAPTVGLSAQSASVIVSLTQIGYAVGLFFLVPLADLQRESAPASDQWRAAAVSLVGRRHGIPSQNCSCWCRYCLA